MVWWISVAMIAPLWGILSTRWFFEAAVALCSAVIGLIGLIAGRVPRVSSAHLLASGMVHATVFGGFVLLGFWVLVDTFGLGYTKWEQVSFVIFAALGTLLATHQIPSQVARFWTSAMTPSPEEHEDLADFLAKEGPRT